MGRVIDESYTRLTSPESVPAEVSCRSSRFDPDGLFRLHLTIIAALAAAHIAVLAIDLLTGRDHLLGINRLFNLNAEGNLPTFFVGVALLATAAVALLISVQARLVAPRTVWGWRFIAACLAFLAIDDVCQVHETIGGIIRAVGSGGSSDASSPWVILYAPLVLIVVAACLPLWVRLPTRTKIGLAMSAILYVGAELGLEFAQMSFVETVGDPRAAGQSAFYKILVTIEEVTGMIAVALLLRTLLTHFSSGGGSLTAQLSAAD